MSLNVGQLMVGLGLDSSNFDAGLNGIEGKAEGTGSSIGSKLMTGIKVAGAAAATAVAGVITASLVKGWGRLTAIEDAEASLRGLGHSADAVKAIMNDALASVKGTAFGMDEAGKVAASAVAAGVKPGKDLERTLKLTADAATIAHSSMGEMGAIFGKVAASGKVQGDVIAQLNDQGIPIIQMLAKELGVTGEEVVDLASKGKINFDQFRNAMETGLGGAAQEAGQTTSGAFKNMGAALSRFGAGLLKDVFPMAKVVFNGISGFLDNLSKTLEPVTAKISAGLGAALGFILPLVMEAKDKVMEFLGSAEAKQLKTDTLERFKSIITNVKTAFVEAWPAIKSILGSLGDSAKSMGLSSWTAMLGVSDALSGVLAKGLAPILDTIAGLLEDNPGLVTALVVAFAAWKVATSVITSGTKIATAVQAAWNAVMSANPIMLVVGALAVLGVAVWLAYQKVGWFRDAVDAVASFLTDTVWPAFKEGASIIKDKIGVAVAWLSDLWSKTLWPALQGVGAWMQSTLWPILKRIGEIIVDGVILHVKTLAWVWSSVLWPALQSVAGWLTGTLWPALQAVGSYIADFMSPIVAGLADTWNNALSPALSAVASLLTGVVWPIIQTVAGFIADVFVANVKVLAWVWSTVLWPALQAVAGFITNYVLPPIASIASVFATVALWVGQRIGEIVGFVVGTPGRIGATISGLWNGLKDGITGAKDWVGGRISEIVDMVTGVPGRIGDLSKKLLNAGKDLIQGFIDGIGEMFGKVKDKLGDLTGKLTSWKGPATLDRVILRDTGRMVIGGFNAGLQDEFPTVKATLGRLTGSLAVSAQSGMAPGSASTTTNVGGVSVTAQTTADPHQIASATAWALKTAGV